MNMLVRLIQRKFAFLSVLLTFSVVLSIEHSISLNSTGPPHFFIMGAQKGGTTAARMNLRKHPDIFLNEGEVHYFDHKGPNADLTLAQYQMKFIKSDQYREGQLVGDCTPAYMTSPNAIYDIQAAFPTAKLLFVLRNPVDRLFSFYHMTMANGKAKNTFEDLIDSDLARSGTFYPNSGPVRRGIYVEHLERISSIFSREQMHFICSEEVKKNLNYNQTFNFLGVRPMQVDSETARENSYPEDVMLAATRDMLNDYYSHWNELLRRWMLLGSPAHQSFVACIDGWSKADDLWFWPILMGV